jgi:hypothetical protein
MDSGLAGSWRKGQKNFKFFITNNLVPLYLKGVATSTKNGTHTMVALIILMPSREVALETLGAAKTVAEWNERRHAFLNGWEGEHREEAHRIMSRIDAEGYITKVLGKDAS